MSVEFLQPALGSLYPDQRPVTGAVLIIGLIYKLLADMLLLGARRTWPVLSVVPPP